MNMQNHFNSNPNGCFRVNSMGSSLDQGGSNNYSNSRMNRWDVNLDHGQYAYKNFHSQVRNNVEPHQKVFIGNNRDFAASNHYSATNQYNFNGHDYYSRELQTARFNLPNYTPQYQIANNMNPQNGYAFSDQIILRDQNQSPFQTNHFQSSLPHQYPGSRRQINNMNQSINQPHIYHQPIESGPPHRVNFKDVNWNCSNHMNEYSTEGIQNRTQPHYKENKLTKNMHEITQRCQPEIIYFDSCEPVQKSDPEVLLEQILQINNDLEHYRAERSSQKRDQQRATIQMKDLKERVLAMKDLIEGNYKVYKLKDLTSEAGQINQMRRHETKRQNRRQEIDFDSLQLIDFEEEFDRLVQISDCFLDASSRYLKEFDQQGNQRIGSHQEENAKTQNNLQYRQQNNCVNGHQYDNRGDSCGMNQQDESLSSEVCISVFIRLIREIARFYNLIYAFQKSSQEDTRNEYGCFVQKSTPSPPALIVNILWQIQTIRLLIKSYQHELILHLFCHSNGQASRQLLFSHTNGQRSRLLKRIKMMCIDIWMEVEELLAQFLEQIMVSPSQQHEYDQTHQTIWYFYYEYSSFNHQWILAIFNTLLLTEMIIDIDLHQVSQQNYIRTQKKPDISENCNENKGKKGHVSSKRNNHDQKHSISMQNCHINTEVQNNLLSILSFLLHPHTSNEENSKANVIHEFLEVPIKQLIVKHVKMYQKFIKNLNSENQHLQSFNKTIAIKYLTIQKITSIVSFYTSKLVSSKSNFSSNHKSHPKNMQIKQDSSIQEGQSFSIELKVMELTLFVRQMADILLSDSPLPKNPQSKSSQTQTIVSETVNWMSKKFTIQSVLSLLFEKIMLKKKRSLSCEN